MANSFDCNYFFLVNKIKETVAPVIFPLEDEEEK